MVLLRDLRFEFCHPCHELVTFALQQLRVLMDPGQMPGIGSCFKVRDPLFKLTKTLGAAYLGQRLTKSHRACVPSASTLSLLPRKL
jgi:hypothetical protein